MTYNAVGVAGFFVSYALGFAFVCWFWSVFCEERARLRREGKLPGAKE
jgi:hypothetical protein